MDDTTLCFVLIAIQSLTIFFADTLQTCRIARLEADVADLKRSLMQ